MVKKFLVNLISKNSFLKPTIKKLLPVSEMFYHVKNGSIKIKIKINLLLKLNG